MNYFKVKTYWIEVFTIRFNSKSIATSSNNLLTDTITYNLRIHELLLFSDLHQHKQPYLWIWDPTQRFSNTNSPICALKTTLEGLDHQQLLILLQQL